jgi:DNA-binding CsgD family transcriptional regulator
MRIGRNQPRPFLSRRPRAVEDALARIITGTASVVGEEYFRALVSLVAQVLSVRYAFVAEWTSPSRDLARILAWHGSDHPEDGPFTAVDSPGRLTIEGGVAYYPDGLAGQFPGNAWLAMLGAESYLAVPLFGPHGPLGHLGVLDVKRMPSAFPGEVLLQAVGPRASAEIQRLRAVEGVRQAADRERAFLHALPDMIFRLAADGTYLDYVPANGQEPYVPPERFLGRKVDQVLPADIARPLMASITTTLITGQTQSLSYRLGANGAERCFEARIVPSGQEEVLAIVRDLGAPEELGPITRAGDELPGGQAERQVMRGNPYGLTFREFTVLQLVAKGATDKEVARQLGISIFTVSKHVSNVLGKMGVSSRTEASVRAVQEGLLG